MADARVVFKADYDDSALTRGVESSKSKLSGLGSAAGKVGRAAAVGIAAVGAAVASQAVLAAKSYAQYQQLTGGIEKLYGEAASSVVANAKAAAGELGISANKYMEQATSFAAALKQSLGGDVRKAAESTQTAIRDMADNVSVFGTNIEDVQRAYQGFAKNNYTMLDNLKLGYGGTKTEMERLIKDANEWEKANGKAGDLTIEKFSDVVQAIHDIQEAQGIAGNAADEALHTVSGSLDSLKAAYDNWLISLGSGEGVDEATQQLAEKIGIFAANIIPVIGEVFASIVSSIPDLFANMGQIFADQGPQLAQGMGQALSDAWNGAVGALASRAGGIQLPKIDAQSVAGELMKIGDGIGNFFGKIQEGFSAIADSPLMTGALNGFMSALGPFYNSVLVPLGDFLQNVIAPVIGVVAGLLGQSLLTGLTMIMNVITTVSLVIQTVWSVISGIVTGIISIVTGIFNTVVSVIQGIISFITNIPATISGILSGLITTISGIITGVISVVSSVPGRIVGFFTSIPGRISSIFNQVEAGIMNAFNNVVNGVRSIPGKIVGFFKSIPDKISQALKSIHVPQLHIEGEFNLDPTNFKLPHLALYAQGGLFTHAAVFGEAGPEYALPLNDRTLSPLAAGISSRIGGGGYDPQVLDELRGLRGDIQTLQIILDTGELVGGLMSQANKVARMYGVRSIKYGTI